MIVSAARPAEDDAIGKVAYITTNPALTVVAEGECANRTYVFYLVAFYTGMRTGELLALTWPTTTANHWTSPRPAYAARSRRRRTEESRKVLLPAWVCKQINALPSRFKRREIFLNGYGDMRAAHLTEYFEKAHEKTSLRRSRQPNYPWRHTYASIGLTSGLDPVFLAKQLGHTLAVFYSTYAKSINTDDDRDKIERAFAEPTGAKTGALTV